jgi:hypothetical protein
MRSIIFRPVEDDEFGTIGLLPEGYSMQPGRLNASVESYALAHDVVEHVNGYGRIGDVSDELEAMGALWWTRGQHADIGRGNYAGHQQPHESVALELTTMFRQCIEGDGDHTPVFNRAGDAEDEFVRIVCQAKLYAPREAHEFSEAAFDSFAVSALTRMRLGYRKARKRYGHEANRLFWSIAEAVARHMKGLEEYGPHLRLDYGLQDGRAFARCSEVDSDSQG